MAAFLSGLFSVWLAVASPLGALDEQWLSVHRVQHLLLMTVAPPLILLGAPPLLLLNGLPSAFNRSFLGPFLRSSLPRAHRIPRSGAAVLLARRDHSPDRMARSRRLLARPAIALLARS